MRSDYERLRSIGIRTARDGIRWHLIEQRPYQYDFSSVMPMVRSARETGIQVIWDICHYGWPDDLDIFDEEFIHRFSSFARAFTTLLMNESDDVIYLSPINEISFFAWGGGEEGILNPFAMNRGEELKRQLVRASIAGIDAIRSASPSARLVQVDPVINVVVDSNVTENERRAAAAHCRAQFSAWDMLAGISQPELEGSRDYLDIVGTNYYVHNQWVYDGQFIERNDPRYRPLHQMLAQVYQRYRRPMFIAETGIEDERRPEWIRYVSDEVIAALENGTPIEGICLYPIVNHPGWADDRHCHNGLWDYCNEDGKREIYSPLAEEIIRQNARIERVRSALRRNQHEMFAVV